MAPLALKDDDRVSRAFDATGELEYQARPFSGWSIGAPGFACDDPHGIARAVQRAEHRSAAGS